MSKISQKEINRTGVSHRVSGSQHTGIVTDLLSCCLVERIDYDNFAWSSKSRAFAEFRLRRSARGRENPMMWLMDIVASVGA